jgi:uncharacterized protein (DUF1810 family)
LGATPFDLERFVDAQATAYATALDELRAGRKRSHGIWFVFPQLRGLGRSDAAWTYGLSSLDEARAYLAHPLLGARLREAVAALLAHRDARADAILGEVDAMKFRSCLTLFARAAPEEAVFAAALAAFFAGAPDPETVAMLEASGET